jgi:cell division protein FtsA
MCKRSRFRNGSAYARTSRLFEAVLTKEEKEAGVAIVDIGGGTTDIAIFKDNIIRHTCVIPYGGGIITDDIKEGCSIIEKHAEQLKVKFGSAVPDLEKDSTLLPSQVYTEDQTKKFL